MADTPTFDPRQIDAIEAGDGLVRVIAGAGTGKTTVLTHRIARLLRQGAVPSRILATTFTNKAAAEMKQRLISICGPEAGAVEIRTIDSAALRVCLRNKELAGINDETLIADEGICEEILEEACIHEGLIIPDLERAEKAATLREASMRVSAWKSAGLNPDQYTLRTGKDWVLVWKRYEEGLLSRNMMDFQDLVIRAVRVLSHPDGLQVEAGRIDHLLVDEFQDTGLEQMRFLSLLSSRSGNVFLVGDPDQSIYSFRKAVQNAFDRAPEVFDVAAERGNVLIELITNRRCTEEILAPACSVIRYNEGRGDKILNSGRLGEEVILSDHATPAMEAEDIVREIQGLVARGEKLADCAVISRTARPLDIVATKLISARIPVKMRGGLRFAERSEVRDVMAYVRLAVNPMLDLSFYRIASRPARGLGPNAVKAIVARAVNGNPLHQVLSEMSMDGSWRIDAREGANELSRHLRELLSMKERARPPHEFISYIVGNIGYTDWAAKKEDAPKTLMASMQTLLDMSKDYDDILDFARESVLDPDAEDDMSDAVTLTTIHASKGLEWKNVFVIALEAGLLPSKRATDDVGDPENPWDHRASGGMQEERRLFHVAMTRAADRLFISRSQSRLNQERVRPSPFLHEAGFDVSSRPVLSVASSGYQVGRGGKKTGAKKARYF